MNGYLWHIAFVNPGSAKLVDRTGVSTLATTDPTVMRIYISDVLSGQEVPMDGSVSLFPMHDSSRVYGKWWTSNGQIPMVKFVLEQPKKQIDESAPLYKIKMWWRKGRKPSRSK